MPSIYVSQLQGSEQSELSEGTSPIQSSLAFGANANPAATLEPQGDASRLRRAVSSFRPGPYQDEHFNNSTTSNNSLPAQSSHDPGLPRPHSVPVAYHGQFDDFRIPPKRELPFLKERENSKNRRASANKLPELPKPRNATTLSVPTKSPAAGAPMKVAKRVAERNTRKKSPIQEKPQAVLPNASNHTGTLPVVPEEEPQLASKSVSAPDVSSGASGLPSTAVSKKRPVSKMDQSLPQAKRPKMVDRSTQTQTLSGRDHTAPLRALSDNTGNTTPVPPTASVLDQIDDFVRANRSRSAPVDIQETSQYANASEEERQAMLNDWICQNIENEDFLKLCKDTEHAWRRIGLGM